MSYLRNTSEDQEFPVKKFRIIFNLPHIEAQEMEEKSVSHVVTRQCTITYISVYYRISGIVSTILEGFRKVSAKFHVKL